jgi:hypothetical protein
MTRTHELHANHSTVDDFIDIYWAFIIYRFMPWYLGKIDNKYVLMNSSYLLFDMSITGSDGWFNFVF